MPLRRTAAALFVSALTLAAAACGGSFETGDIARDRAVELTGCPAGQLTMEQIGAYRYRATGCGQQLTLACTAGSMEAHCFRERRSDEDPDAVAAAGAESEQSSGSEASTTGGSAAEASSSTGAGAEENSSETAGVEARIRAGLEARREDILACAGRDRAAVRVEHAADGAITISLQGDLAGSAEERCVREALAGVRAPAGEAGTVVHLLRAP